jgi:hypothetical protein
MDTNKRTSLAFGVVLILAGAFFLAAQFMPGLRQLWESVFDWPAIVVGVGALLLLIGLFSGNPDMAVPACIVAGIGGILFYQNTSGDWSSWSYMWALIPGFSGLGLLLAGLLAGMDRGRMRRGVDAILSSLILFTIFGAFFGGLFRSFLGIYWPLLLVAAGVLILLRNLFWRK